MALHSSVGRQGNVTSGQGNPASNYLFDTESQTNLSAVVTVDDDPIVVKAFNLEATDIVLVEMVAGSGSGDVAAPFSPRGVQESLTMNRNVLPIGMSGRYRFTLQTTGSGLPRIGLVLVVYHKVAMTHEWVNAYMTPLICSQQED